MSTFFNNLSKTTKVQAFLHLSSKKLRKSLYKNHQISKTIKPRLSKIIRVGVGKNAKWLIFTLIQVKWKKKTVTWKKMKKKYWWPLKSLKVSLPNLLKIYQPEESLSLRQMVSKLKKNSFRLPPKSWPLNIRLPRKRALSNIQNSLRKELFQCCTGK